MSLAGTGVSGEQLVRINIKKRLPFLHRLPGEVHMELFDPATKARAHLGGARLVIGDVTIGANGACQRRGLRQQRVVYPAPSRSGCRQYLGDIERAIQTSDLGLTPANDGKLIRIKANKGVILGAGPGANRIEDVAAGVQCESWSPNTHRADSRKFRCWCG